MNKKIIVNFLKVLGFQINEEDLKESEAPATAGDPAPATNAQPTVNTAALVANEAPVVPAPAIVSAVVANEYGAASDQPAQPAQAPDAAPQNLKMLDELINAIGGFEAFKGLLLKLAEMGQQPAATPSAQANAEKAALEARANSVIAQLVANSNGRLTADKFSGIDLAVLEALGQAVQANAVVPAAPVIDFSGLGVFKSKNALVTANADLAGGAPRPSVLLAKRTA